MNRPYFFKVRITFTTAIPADEIVESRLFLVQGRSEGQVQDRLEAKYGHRLPRVAWEILGPSDINQVLTAVQAPEQLIVS